MKPLRKLDTAAVTTVLDDWFLDHGKPVNLRSDGGPQFRREFDHWCKEEKINHELSSAYHHQSNGHAECTVREMKSLLAKTKNFKEFRRALREWRNTPQFNGLSRAQWLTGHRQKTEVAAAPEAYQRVNDAKLKHHENLRGMRQAKEKERTDKPSKTLEQLSLGQTVLVQDHKTKQWSHEATIVEKRSRRSYLVEMDGRQHLRNRQFIKPKVPDTTNHMTIDGKDTQVNTDGADGQITTQKRNLRQRKVKFTPSTEC